MGQHHLARFGTASAAVFFCFFFERPVCSITCGTGAAPKWFTAFIDPAGDSCLRRLLGTSRAAFTTKVLSFWAPNPAKKTFVGPKCCPLEGLFQQTESKRGRGAFKNSQNSKILGIAEFFV